MNTSLNRRALLGQAAAVFATTALPWATARAAETLKKSPFKTPIAAPTLAYDQAALAPVISANTVGFHFGKHHLGYFNKLKELVPEKDLASMTLEELVQRNAPAAGAAPSAIFNNAAQIWNHNFYWDSLRADGGGTPGKALLTAIEKDFESFTAFRDKFVAASVAQFGSGWTWLVKNKATGKLAIVTTGNALTPITDPNLVPLCVVDVWEHAYYLDYQNKRADYAKAVFDKLINWGFAEANLSA
jgi:Fe-Mn family superoxide dismutase